MLRSLGLAMCLWCADMLTAQAATTSDGALVVAVDAEPSAGVHAADLRRAIGQELSRPVRAPWETTAGSPEPVLTVGVSARGATVLFHDDEREQRRSIVFAARGVT